MIDYIEEDNYYKFDIGKVEEARNFCNEKFTQGSYGFTQETAEQMCKLVQEIVDSCIKERRDRNCQRKETEEEAKEYFGEDFIQEFEEIRRFCSEHGISLAIHGTGINSARKIQEEGLEYRTPQILSTAIFQEKTTEEHDYQKYSDLLNWPHRHYKGLVLVGIPDECAGVYDEISKTGVKPLWELHDSEERYEKHYTINSEFILGYIDVEKKEIVQNPNFSLSHNYEGLEFDTDISRIKRKDVERVDTNEEYSSTYEVDEETYIDEELYIDEETRTSDDLLIDSQDEIMYILSIFMHNPDGMWEELVSEKISSLQRLQNEIKSIISQLKTNEEIEKSKIESIKENGIEGDDFWDVDGSEWIGEEEDDKEEFDFYQDTIDTLEKMTREGMIMRQAEEVMSIVQNKDKIKVPNNLLDK